MNSLTQTVFPLCSLDPMGSINTFKALARLVGMCQKDNITCCISLLPWVLALTVHATSHIRKLIFVFGRGESMHALHASQKKPWRGLSH